MTRPRSKALRGKAVTTAEAFAAWGWYAVALVPTPKDGGSMEGLVIGQAPNRAFYAVWWTGDPRREGNDPDPDEYGFVTGAMPLDEAVGASYVALTKGRGRFIYDVCIGEAWALRAFKEGAPQKRSSHTDFAAVAAKARGFLGIEQGASEAEIKAAWRAFVLANHPDHAGSDAPRVDMDEAKKLVDALIAEEKRVAETQLRQRVVGGLPVDRRRLIAKVRKLAKRYRSNLEVLFAGLSIHVPTSAGGTVEAYNPKTLKGFCTIASLGLLCLLEESDVAGAAIATGSTCGHPHWWVDIALGEGAFLIVDVTHTQFRERAPAVYLVESGAKAASDYKADSRYRAYSAVLGYEMLDCNAHILGRLPPFWYRDGGSLSEQVVAELLHDITSGAPARTLTIKKALKEIRNP